MTCCLEEGARRWVHSAAATRSGMRLGVSPAMRWAPRMSALINLLQGRALWLLTAPFLWWRKAIHERVVAMRWEPRSFGLAAAHRETCHPPSRQRRASPTEADMVEGEGAASDDWFGALVWKVPVAAHLV